MLINIIDNMFFSDYSQFLEPDIQINTFMAPTIATNYTQSANFMNSQLIAAQHDAVYSQFTQTISKRLVSNPYPSNFKSNNPFCPVCLKLVQKQQIFSTCYINNDRNYLIHSQCLQKQKGYQMRSIGDLIESSFKVKDNEQTSNYKFQLGLDSRHFYVQVALYHPLNQKCFVKINKKVTLIRNYFSISFNEKQIESYFPNMIVVPLTDFHISVSVVQFGKTNSRSKFTKYLSLRNLKDSKSIKVESDDIWFTAQIIQDKIQKQRVLDQMNYKYKYGDMNEIPLLRIFDFSIRLPQEFEESEDEEFIIENNSTIVQELLKETEPSLSTIRSSQHSPQKRRVISSDSNQSSPQLSGSTQQVNLQKLILTNKLIEFVKNNTQSRLFQNYLSQASPSDIELIIRHIKPHAIELIMHQYGNYMIQKLFSVCHPYQRLQIIQQIMPNFCDLIRNKQGTHTLQAFISHFSLNEEYTMVILQIRQDFYQLCRNNNSTHFIQKVLKTFPIQFMLPYFSYTTQNLLAFALDKNAMCVIKHMMRRLRQLQGKQQFHFQSLQLIRRQLITQVTFNVDKLIMDSYGNYVIQFCYELFDLQKCVGITERILSRFSNYAIGKFSSNVLLKCITSYWADKRIYNSLKVLTNNQLVQIFRNKDGNKILLQFMQRLQGTQFWDRLYSVLIRIEPTRFYHDRWGVCLGSRSGQVGTRFNSFPQPNKKKNFCKKF